MCTLAFSRTQQCPGSIRKPQHPCSKLPQSSESRIPISKLSTRKTYSASQTSKLGKKESKSSPPKPPLIPKAASAPPCPPNSLPQHVTRPSKHVRNRNNKSGTKTDTPSNKRSKTCSVQPSHGTSVVQDKKTTRKAATKQSRGTMCEGTIVKAQSNDTIHMIPDDSSPRPVILSSPPAVSAEYQVGTGHKVLVVNREVGK